MSRDPLRRPGTPALTLTPLNLATDARHAACIASGGHVPSEVMVMRDGTEMVVCARCGVPTAPGGKAWAAMYREAAKRGGAAKHRPGAAA